MKRFYLLVAFLIISCEDNNTSTINQELTFISSEGNFGSSNASISVYKGDLEIQKIAPICYKESSRFCQHCRAITIIGLKN